MFSTGTIWVVIALLLLGAEFLSAGFLLIFFSFGAALSAIAAFFGLGILWQMALFAIGSLLSMAVGRPFLMKYFKIDKDVKSSTMDAMVGLRGVVVKPIKPLEYGQVRVQGDVWTAGCEGNCDLVEGEEVEVRRVDGVKLIVGK